MEEQHGPLALQARFGKAAVLVVRRPRQSGQGTVERLERMFNGVFRGLGGSGDSQRGLWGQRSLGPGIGQVFLQSGFVPRGWLQAQRLVDGLRDLLG
jgi:hypothetical protein